MNKLFQRAVNEEIDKNLVKARKAYSVKLLCETLKRLGMYNLKSFTLNRVDELPEYTDNKYVQNNFDYIVNVVYEDEYHSDNMRSWAV